MNTTNSPHSLVFNVDCMEYMKSIPDRFFDLVVSDPPYFSGPERRAFYGKAVSATAVARKEYPVTDKWKVLADKQAALIAERAHPKTTSRRNAQINAELLKLSQGRKAIRSRILQAQDESELVLIKKYLREHAPDILQDFYKTIPQRQKFAKI